MNATLMRLSMGAWLLYGLGSENQDLPGYITINPAANFGGAELRQRVSPGPFSGDAHQRHGRDARPPGPNGHALTASTDRFDSGHESRSGGNLRAPDEMDGVIQSFELAFRMEGKVSTLLDISREPQSVLDAYGVKPGPGGSFARQCLMARRLSEAGVRFVEICQGGWDHHSNLHKGLINNCRMTDQPTAALLTDLEQRGCWTRRLFCSAASSGVSRRPRDRTVGTTTSRVIRCGWPAPAETRLLLRSDRRIRHPWSRRQNAHH